MIPDFRPGPKHHRPVVGEDPYSNGNLDDHHYVVPQTCAMAFARATIIVAKMCGTARPIPMLLHMTPTCSVLPVSGQIRWFRVCKGTGQGLSLVPGPSSLLECLRAWLANTLL
jgi:hypothetical protein